MAKFLADFHIHTQLSPCGSLEMTPMAIIEKALEKGLNTIAITDHNSTLQVELAMQLGKEYGILVIPGAEINSIEEVHCLCLFPDLESTMIFQEYLNNHLIPIKNKPDKFGYQVVINQKEEIQYEEENLLIAALDTDILSIERKVHELNGIFIPAHIDRYYNGLISQLGMIPEDLKIDALGLSPRADFEKWINDPRIPENITLLYNSDAHSPQQLGNAFTELEMQSNSFEEIRLALHNKHRRKVISSKSINL